MSRVEAGFSKGRRWQTVLVMLVAVSAVTIGDLFMSMAMKALGPLRLESFTSWWNGKIGIGPVLAEGYALLWTIFGQPLVWLAIGFMLTFMVLWMVALSWADLTFVMPLTALTYVLNAILVGPFLGESVSPTRWLGTLMIAAGVALVGTEPDPGCQQLQK